MPRDDTNRAFLKRIYGILADKPLQPGSQFYEPVFEELPLRDPVQEMLGRIDFAGSESIQLFSGFRGSGKTTELLRLKRELERDGYFVVYADALDYVNAAEPIEISELLLVLAGAFSDQLDALLGDAAGDSFWDRVLGFIRDIHVEQAGLKLEMDTPGKAWLGGLKTSLDLKFGLKSAVDFRGQLKKVLDNRLKQLKDAVDTFFEDGIKRIRADRGEDTEVVFIFDQLEQLRGTLQTEHEMIRSVQRIFAIHIDLLKLPYVHAVYTVPPWLKFVLPGAVQMVLLSTPHLWENDAARTRCEPAWDMFRSLVRRRLGDDGLRRLFGDDGAATPLVDRLIDVCGGHFRDLLRLLSDVVLLARAAPGLPVDRKLIDNVINTARRDFLPIAQDDAKWLEEIARVRATALPSTDPAQVNRLARFFDSHSALYFINGDEWYDVHPLIREEIANVMASIKPPAAG